MPEAFAELEDVFPGPENADELFGARRELEAAGRYWGGGGAAPIFLLMRWSPPIVCSTCGVCAGLRRLDCEECRKAGKECELIVCSGCGADLEAPAEWRARFGERNGEKC